MALCIGTATPDLENAALILTVRTAPGAGTTC